MTSSRGEGTTEGWALDLAGSGTFAASDGTIAASTTRASTGTHSFSSITGVFISNPNNASSYLELVFTIGGPWVGTIFVDDIEIR